mgnify:FL=1
MALTRADWEQIKDRHIETEDMLPQHLVGYNILRRLFTDKQMLQYTSNMTVYSQYHSTCLATYVGDKDYKLGVSKSEVVNDYDDFGRPIPDKYITVHKYHAYVRADRISNYISEVGDNFKGIALSLTNNSKLREFINQVDTSGLYLSDYNGSLLYGRIDINVFNKHFQQYDKLLFHDGDNTFNYFSTYEKSTKRMCNRKEYYVNLMKLTKALDKK